VLRLYREEGLKLRAGKRKRVASTQRVQPEATSAINQRWSMDFMSDTLSCGRRFRSLNIVDCHSREALCSEVGRSLTGQRVVRALQRLGETRDLPQTIQVDNGPEFTGRDLDEWAFKNRVKLLVIEPGKMRDECLNQEWFCGLDEARVSIERWRDDYNQLRPHSALDNLAPAVWAQRQALENLYARAR